MRQVSRIEVFWALLLGVALFVSGVALIELHCRARQIYIEHERELDVQRRLLDEQADLEMKVRRVSLAGSIGAGVAMLGLEGATGADTVTLVEHPDGSIGLTDELRRELEAIDGVRPTSAGGRS